MSQAININTRVIYPDSPHDICDPDSGVVVSRSKVTIVGAAQMQRRPASRRTTRRGDAYVYPTSWSHVGCYNTSPSTSGEIQPVGVPYLYRWRYLNGMFRVSPNPDDISQPSLGDAEDLVGAVTTQVLLKLKDQKINLGVALAEAKDTAKLIGTNAKRIANLLQRGRRGNPKEWFTGVREAGRNWKKVPNYYLEHLYGITPLMSDIDGACQQLAKTVGRGNSPLVTAFAGASVLSEFDIALTPMQQFGQLRGIGTQKASARVGIIAEAPDWVMQDFNSLGLTNPFAIAWEKAPYSFCLDWMLPVGDWINTWDVGNYLRFTSGYTTRFVSRTGAVVPVANPDCPVWSVRVDLPGRLRHWSMDRTPMVTFPKAAFPSLKSPLSLNTVAQGLALLTQVIKGDVRDARR